VDQLAARADIGGHRRHSGRKALEQHQRQGFADRTEHDQPELGHQLVDLLEAQETHLVLDAQRDRHRAALQRVGPVLVLGTGDPAFGLRKPADHRLHRAHEGLDVLDRHHAPDQAQHLGRLGRAQRAQRCQARQVDAVGDIAGLLGRCAIGDLAQPVGLVQRHDAVGGVVAHAPHRLEEADPHVTEVTELRGVLFEHAPVVADPVALEQVDLAFLGVDAVLGQQQWLAGHAPQDRPQEARVAGGDRVVAVGRDQLLATAAASRSVNA
jgi:hypothetical protein